MIRIGFEYPFPVYNCHKTVRPPGSEIIALEYFKIVSPLRLLPFSLLRPPDTKVKVKLSLCLTKHHAVKTYWGSGGISPCILNLGARWW
jgi:hypothetical protein